MRSSVKFPQNVEISAFATFPVYQTLQRLNRQSGPVYAYVVADFLNMPYRTVNRYLTMMEAHGVTQRPNGLRGGWLAKPIPAPRIADVEVQTRLEIIDGSGFVRWTYQSANGFFWRRMKKLGLGHNQAVVEQCIQRATDSGTAQPLWSHACFYVRVVKLLRLVRAENQTATFAVIGAVPEAPEMFIMDWIQQAAANARLPIAGDLVIRDNRPLPDGLPFRPGEFWFQQRSTAYAALHNERTSQFADRPAARLACGG